MADKTDVVETTVELTTDEAVFILDLLKQLQVSPLQANAAYVVNITQSLSAKCGRIIAASQKKLAEASAKPKPDTEREDDPLDLKTDGGE